ncbi:MAG: hypothetical protein M3Y27_26610, partial [Acidobacteriota bacterium]|nr:hypothetical protein [Acidobacteriota bacterium]
AFRYLRKTGQGRRSVWSICWARDSQSIYDQDFDNIYQLSFDGTELRKWSVNSMFPKGALSSSSGMAISPDGNVLVIDVEMDEETANSIGSDDGPPTAIWTYNLATGKAERITKPGLMAWHPCWLNDNEILFSTQARKEKTPSLYKLSIPPKQAARLLQNANDPVAAAPFP